MNKKGNIMVLIVFIALLFLILFLGFIMVVGSSVINYVFDITVPELTNMGTVGDANFTEISDQTVKPVNTIIQSMTFMTGVFYILMLIGSIGIAFAFRTSPNKWFIGFYFLLVLLLVIASMFISNMYEDFYNGTGDLETRLQEHFLLSYMILYSPAIFTVISFITGIVLFSGMQEEGFA